MIFMLNMHTDCIFASTFNRPIAAAGRLRLNIAPKDQIPREKVDQTHTGQWYLSTAATRVFPQLLVGVSR